MSKIQVQKIDEFGAHLYSNDVAVMHHVTNVFFELHCVFKLLFKQVELHMHDTFIYPQTKRELVRGLCLQWFAQSILYQTLNMRQHT